jgi:uncharacterized membrane protein YphA (DoxX/SURF4 family)
LHCGFKYRISAVFHIEGYLHHTAVSFRLVLCADAWYEVCGTMCSNSVEMHLIWAVGLVFSVLAENGRGEIEENEKERIELSKRGRK